MPIAKLSNPLFVKVFNASLGEQTIGSPFILNEVFSTNQDSNKINQYTKTPKLPLPYIKNLRKWINKDKKAS